MKKSNLELPDGTPEAIVALFTDAARDWLDALLTEFAPRREALLQARRLPSAAPAATEQALLSAATHADEWSVDEIPADLRDRRVELHVAADADALRTALASAASTVVLDLEETLPVPSLALSSQALMQAALGNARKETPPAFVFGPRALETTETGVRWRRDPAPAGLLDAGLFLFYQAPLLQAAGRSPCLRLSRIESADEAALWHDLLRFAEESGVATAGAPRVTAAIETLPAIFACDAIVRELRHDLAALTFNRHACLRSFIRGFPGLPQFLLPDRAELSTSVHFLHCWSLVLVGSAHRRQASAIGPVASFLPPSRDDDPHWLLRLRADKERHAHEGFDGSGVAHPDLCAIAREAFDRLMPGQHQQHRKRDDLRITGADLLQVHKGKITEQGLRRNLRIALQGLLATAAGKALLDLDDRRETRASVEFAADQLWQWLKLDTGVLDDGRIIDQAFMLSSLEAERDRLTVPAEAARAAGERLTGHLLAAELPLQLLGNSVPD